jgi:hypothetical protein
MILQAEMTKAQAAYDAADSEYKDANDEWLVAMADMNRAHERLDRSDVARMNADWFVAVTAVKNAEAARKVVSVERSRAKAEIAFIRSLQAKAAK